MGVCLIKSLLRNVVFFIITFFTILSAKASESNKVKSYTLTADITYITDYMVRGRSVNDGTYAIQGHVLFIKDNFFLGVWATTLDVVGEYNSEIDYYGGYRFNLNKTTNLDLYLQAITVPGLKDFTFWRMNAAFSGRLDTLTWRFLASYDPQQGSSFTKDGDAAYASISATLPIEDTAFSIVAGIGYETGVFVATADENKIDWYAGLSTKALGLNWEAKYVGTDAREVYEPRVLFSIQKVF